MSKYLLLKQGTIHNAVEREPFVADILIEDGKIKKIAPVLEGKVSMRRESSMPQESISIRFVDAIVTGLDGFATGYTGQITTK